MIKVKIGQTFYMQGNRLHVTPDKQGVLALMRKCNSAPIIILIKKLNEVLRR